LADINGDGKADFVASYANARALEAAVMISNGDGTFGAPQNTYYSLNASGNTVSWADINGDGKTDFVSYHVNLSGWTRYVAMALPSNIPQAIMSFSTGLSASTAISYVPLSTALALGGVYTKGTSAVYPTQDYQGSTYVVSNVAASNGLSLGTYNSSYTYSTAQVDLGGRGFLGFGSMTAYDPQLNIYQTTTYSQTFPTIGLVTQRTKGLSPSSALSTLNNNLYAYLYANSGGGMALSTPTILSQTSANTAPYFANTEQTVEKSWDLDGSAMPSMTTTYSYDAYGNPTTITVITPDGHSKVTTNTYVNDTVHWLLGRLTGSSVTSAAP
jgi:YD repeat-containing protein